MASSQNTDSSARDDVPDGPTDLSGGSWLAAAKRALKEYKADDLQDRARAALALPSRCSRGNNSPERSDGGQSQHQALMVVPCLPPKHGTIALATYIKAQCFWQVQDLLRDVHRR